MTALSAEQLLVLLESSRGDRLHPLWVLLSCAGLRLGEALGLRWQDVDLDGGRLAVRRALQRRRSGSLVFVDPTCTTLGWMPAVSSTSYAQAAPVATTHDTYSHVLPVLHGDAIRVLDGWLGERRPM
jgi:site-specific recombinase XerC